MSLSIDDQKKYKALYIQTAKQYTEEILNNLKLLKTKNDFKEIIGSLHREAHSLKGQSEMMGYQNIAALSSLLENIFLLLIEAKIVLSDELKNKLLESVEASKSCLDEIEQTNTEIDLSSFTKDLQLLSQPKS